MWIFKYITLPALRNTIFSTVPKGQTAIFASGQSSALAIHYFAKINLFLLIKLK